MSKIPCPYCRSKKTVQVLIFKRTKRGKPKITDDTMRQCDKCGATFTHEYAKDQDNG